MLNYTKFFESKEEFLHFKNEVNRIKLFANNFVKENGIDKDLIYDIMTDFIDFLGIESININSICHWRGLHGDKIYGINSIDWRFIEQHFDVYYESMTAACNAMLKSGLELESKIKNKDNLYFRSYNEFKYPLNFDRSECDKIIQSVSKE